MLEELPRESPSLELLKTQVGTATCSWPFSEQEVGVGDWSVIQLLCLCGSVSAAVGPQNTYRHVVSV